MWIYCASNWLNYTCAEPSRAILANVIEQTLAHATNAHDLTEAYL